MTIAELRRMRMARGVSLTEISRRTRIGIGHLRNIEDGSLTALPPGFYARAFVRTYAEAVGADADAVLSTIGDQLPSGGPLPDETSRSAASGPTAAELVPDARMSVLRQILDRHEALEVQAADRHQARTAEASRPLWRIAAAGVDAALMLALYTSVLALTAWACGVPVGELVRVAGPAVFTVLGLITLLYVVMMGGIAGRTIGSMLLDVPLTEPPAASPLQPHAIWQRSLQFLRADASAAVAIVSMLTRTRKAA